MADTANGWQTVVLPHAHSRVSQLDRAQLAAYERQALDLWAQAEGDWSGCGKHTTDVAEAKKLHSKLKSTIVQKLGQGGQGEVEKLNYTHKNRSVVLARKRLKGFVDILRAEADNLERLCHDHIVRLIGTYSNHRKELYLLLWPAATRDLASLLNDLDDLRFDGGDRADILERLGELELRDTSAIDHPYAIHKPDIVSSGCPLDYLRRSMGCLTEALKYCHDSNIRHLDLKPENILVSPGQVHLADFGISRDVTDQEHTMTCQEIGTKKWFAPERFSRSGGWSMKTGGDIYSLGLVFLNIAAIMYGMKQSDFSNILKQVDWKLKLDQLNLFLEKSEKQALATQDFADARAPTYRPKHIITLIRSMTDVDPEKRPDTTGVSRELYRLGGLEQVYFNPCCKASPRALTQLLDEDYAIICNERNSLARENERIGKRLNTLEAAVMTYDMRIQNQQQKFARDLAHVTKQLDEAKRRNSELETKPQQGHLPRPGAARPKLKSPNRHYSNPPEPVVNTAQEPKPRRPSGPDMRKSTGSLPNYSLRSHPSASRLPQPINPSTPRRSGTPSTPRDANLTDSTIDSMASSLFSRRTTSSGLSPNPSPSASKILVKTNNNEPTESRGAEYGLGISQAMNPAPQVASKTFLSDDLLVEIGSQHGGSVQDTISLASEEQSEFARPARKPSLPVAKSWAAIAGDKQGLAGMLGAAVAGKKKKAQ